MPPPSSTCLKSLSLRLSSQSRTSCSSSKSYRRRIWSLTVGQSICWSRHYLRRCLTSGALKTTQRRRLRRREDHYARIQQWMRGDPAPRRGLRSLEPTTRQLGPRRATSSHYHCGETARQVTCSTSQARFRKCLLSSRSRARVAVGAQVRC